MGIFDAAREMGHEQIVFSHDRATGLKAIVAIHDTTLGPALGGCRVWNYATEDEAIFDVLRLSRGMTYKAAVAGLALGGGKAVIIGDPKKIKTEALFRAFGRFVNGLDGRYITAEDVNVTTADIDNVAMETKYCAGIASRAGGSGDPSPVTALGVFSGIKASVKHKLKRDSLNGLTVAIQGVGAVGSWLARYLNDEGAKLIIADIDQGRLDSLSNEFGAKIVSVDDIHSVDCDVFAPCALGGGLNDKTIPTIKAPIVAGGANNQLLDEDKHGEQIRKRDILYAPDYVINAGGLINVYHELRGYNAEAAKRQARRIEGTLLEIYEEADRQDISYHRASDTVAERRIQSIKQMSDLRKTYNNQAWIQNK
jgi:leucine dehydrogenase